jgi:hypothetical protein
VTEPALENASRLLDAIVYGALPDYAVFDRQTLDRQEGEPWRFLDWGFFDAGWRPAASASMEGQ